MSAVGPSRLEDSIREFFAAAPEGVAAVYLFGSTARATSRPHGDVDVGVLLEEDPPATLEGLGLRLEGELERHLGPQVDLVILNGAPTDLVHRVLRDGKLLVDRNPSRRIRFEVLKRNEYFDLEPVLRQYRHHGPERLTDPELVAKKLAFIETCVRELRKLADPSRLASDVREERFVAHTLQLAIQAALDVASHIVSDERLGEPSSNRELFELLARSRWLSRDLGETMQDMAGFRNVLVHGYARVDLRIMRDLVENRLEDLLKFVAAIRARLGGA